MKKILILIGAVIAMVILFFLFAMQVENRAISYEEAIENTGGVNIKNRVGEAVLRDKLLKPLDNGAYEPKKLKREKVKEVLLSFRKHLPKTGSECIQMELNTFGYV